MEKDKIETLLGFAVKAGKVTFGTDTLLSGKRVYAAFVDTTLAENALKRLTQWAERTGTVMYLSDKPIEQIVYRKNCKAIGLKDRQMAEAIQKHKNEHYKQIVAEGKKFDETN